MAFVFWILYGCFGYLVSVLLGGFDDSLEIPIVVEKDLDAWFSFHKIPPELIHENMIEQFRLGLLIKRKNLSEFRLNT